MSESESERIESKVSRALEKRESKDITSMHAPIPIGKLLSFLVVIGGGIWWMADQAADLRACKADTAEARRIAIAAEATAMSKSTEVLTKLAEIGSNVQALKSQSQGIEVQVSELRAALLRGRP